MLVRQQIEHQRQLTLLVLPLELLDKVVDKSVVKVFTTKVSVTSGSLNLEDTLLNSQERDIESTTTKVVDDDLGLLLATSVETVS